MGNFFNELRRRGVLHTTGLCIVCAWAGVQASDLAFESWRIADAALHSVWALAIVWFPLALGFGWPLRWPWHARHNRKLDGLCDTPRFERLPDAIETGLVEQPASVVPPGRGA